MTSVVSRVLVTFVAAGVTVARTPVESTTDAPKTAGVISRAFHKILDITCILTLVPNSQSFFIAKSFVQATRPHFSVLMHIRVVASSKYSVIYYMFYNLFPSRLNYTKRAF